LLNTHLRNYCNVSVSNVACAMSLSVLAPDIEREFGWNGREFRAAHHLLGSRLFNQGQVALALVVAPVAIALQDLLSFWVVGHWLYWMTSSAP
jgi:hypothetical protein